MEVSNKDDLIQLIRQAFADVPRPPVLVAPSGIGLGYRDSIELDELLRTKTREELTVKDVDAVLDSHSLLTPCAHHYFLPTCMVTVLQHESRMIRGLEWLLYMLKYAPKLRQDNPDDAAKCPITAPQQQAVCAFLWYLTKQEESQYDLKVNKEDWVEAFKLWSNLEIE